MAQSPELAGGEGFTFEGDAAAYYLVALLDEAHAPGIDDRSVIQVSLQQRDFGEPLDDVIVDFEDSSKSRARLSLQVKRTLTISQAKTNKDFREIVRDSWATLKKSDFRLQIDRFGAAVGTVSAAKERALKTLCDLARESSTASHFDARFSKRGNAGKGVTTVKNDVVALLHEAKGEKCTSDEVHQFLAHFVLVKFDFLREGATAPSDAMNRIRGCLAPHEVNNAALVWSKIVQLSRASAGKSGQFDRTRLVRLVSAVARLKGAVSLSSDLTKLTELAVSQACLIPDDIGGVKLHRTVLLEQLANKLSDARLVQVRGLPGSGKSVVVRRAVEQSLDTGPVIFLKAEQLEGTSWRSYATSQGISDAPLDRLLTELGAVGTPTLFIDAIDRVEKAQQPIILDVVRTIAESPLLDNWRIVVSLRDTGIEVLRNWLGELLDALSIDTLGVKQLSDDEADDLANSKPHLRPLLFGADKVQQIVRRPFFAKVLNQSFVADPESSLIAPQSEVDLVENWWRRGGYNETGQSAVERQRTLLDLARTNALKLGKPITLGWLQSVAHIDDLRSDGILQNEREGISVRFAHDIFFEWAFFYVLAEGGSQWIDSVIECGEPPAVARVVELVAQWEYAHGDNWSTSLSELENSALRSQWLRSWLVAPLGLVEFENDTPQFEKTVFVDDFRLFRKLLVWFQAEKTVPNPGLLTSEISESERQQFSDLFAWPSDYAAWRRLIEFVLSHIVDIPQRLFPEIVAIFGVWQNALAQIRNPISKALLQQCSEWLAGIDAIDVADRPDENSAYWGEVPELGAFRESLVQLILRSSRAEPSFAFEYLRRVTESERIREKAFQDIIAFSPTLAESLAPAVVDLALAFFKKELPEERVTREREEASRAAELREKINARPEAERTRHEQMMLTSGFHSIVGGFSHYDWDKLSINRDYSSFSPPSPLREPFKSLFHFSPAEALRLLRELCNHAIAAWRQLHRYSHESQGTPIPLALIFPWGQQRFWGTDREYLWCRSTWAPGVIGSGFMALEEWCFAEIERGRATDEIIEEVVRGNECIGILGVASALALDTETVSEATLPLFTSQRLLAADRNRRVQDFSQTTNLIGFIKPTDRPHAEAVKAANKRPVRRKDLSWMVPGFIFADGSLSEQARDAIFNFKDNLPYQYEEHRTVSEARDDLSAQAELFAELANRQNYQAYRTTENSDQVAVVHVSPSAAQPENIAKAEEASRRLSENNLWAWASRSLDDNMLGDRYSVNSAIALAKTIDVDGLFEQNSAMSADELQVEMARGAVAGTAAVVLHFREGLENENLIWAREILARAIQLKETSAPMRFSGSDIPWHPAHYVARGLAADLLFETAADVTAQKLLGLIAHPLEKVSLTAVNECCKLWPKDSRLCWAGLSLAFLHCQYQVRSPSEDREYSEPFRLEGDTEALLSAAVKFYESDSAWVSLPSLPAAWVKRDIDTPVFPRQPYDYSDDSDGSDEWGEPDVSLDSKRYSEILQLVPFASILESNARDLLLDSLEGALAWVIQKNVPPWTKPGRSSQRSTNAYELTHRLASSLGLVAGHLPIDEFRTRFLNFILALEDDACWAMLSPLMNTCICVHVYDADCVPTDVIPLIELCLNRFLDDRDFQPNTFRRGSFGGSEKPEIIRTLMFVSVEHADLAARYANGDWSEVSLILPVIDRFIRAGGWASAVMGPFLTLCERSKDHYPADDFADQILSIIGNGPDCLRGWQGTMMSARVAGLVQFLAHREAPMCLPLSQKLLRILDILVDMGDRRSAALQLGEAFRSVRLDS